MQLTIKNKINFITEMMWLRHNEEHKVNVNQMKKQGQFNYCCKTVKLIPSYGFVSINATQKTNQIEHDTRKVKQKAVTIKNPISLGLFVVHALDINKEVDDLFICFRVDETQIGYVFIYKGAIFANDGEYVSDVDKVKVKITTLAREYNIKNIRIFDDVPFYDDAEFFLASGLENVVSVAAVVDTSDKDKNETTIAASDYHLWQHKTIKKTLAKALIRPITLLQREHRLVLALVGVVAAGMMAVHLKAIYFPDQSVAEQAQLYVYENKTGVNAGVFLEKCFVQIDEYLQSVDNWKLTDFNCTLSGLHINYTSDNGSANDITNVIKDPHLNVAAESKTASVDWRYDLTKLYPDVSNDESLVQQLEKLKADAKENSLNVLMKGVSTVEITSKLSPIYLYNHDVIRNLNILEISMTPDDSGLFNWTIKGDLNGK
jgi:hypothetical protein